MINKANILKAVSEGIKSGFKFSSNKDDSLSIDFSDSKINNIESFNIRKMEERDFIDLGLSVKWAKYNIGATCQDTPKSWYGNYYAWGECEPKQIYNKDSYDLTLYKKYNKDAFHVLQPEDDIVTLTYYGIDKFRMPTKEECEELLDESKIKSTWKTNYQGIKGLYGREFTSKINGNFIFIPATGCIFNSLFVGVTSLCLLWSNSLYLENAHRSICIHFNPGYCSVDKDYYYVGYSVRGVCS